VRLVPALAVLLLWPAGALADVGRARAIAIVERTPAARTLVLQNPTATFGASHSPGIWSITLAKVGSARPLGSWTLDARNGRVLGGSALSPAPPTPRITGPRAALIARNDPRISDWIRRYRKVTDATNGPENGLWTVHLWSGGQEIAQATVSDATGKVRDAWTGPQVAWRMARGYDGAFGRRINDPAIWIGLCAVFLLGLLDWRRPLSLRTLDLLALLSFSVSLAYFNQGLVFWSVPLAYPPLLYLIARLTWIGFRGRRERGRQLLLPATVLAAAAVFLVGFRVGLNAYDSNVIDVGYAGVIGADRMLRGEVPYGAMPTNKGSPCGVRYSDGTYAAYRQARQRGRCEAPNERGDTYGPLTYAAYVPAVAALGWSGRWDDLPAAHVTSVVFDSLCILGLLVAGRRLGGTRLGVLLAFAWLAYPFTAYALESNSNDMILAALLIWGFVAVTSPMARGALLGLSAWAKFAPLLLVPLWARYPRTRRLDPGAEWPYDRPEAAPPPAPPRARLHAVVAELGPRARLVGFAVGLLVGSGLALLLLSEGGRTALTRFWDSTFGWQLSRPSPFSVWDWGIYPGFPDLSALQTGLKVALVLGALALLVVPRRLDAVRLAALTGAVLIGFELVLTHWFYLYIPWFFPFAALALFAPPRRA
jgi:hypothetical protein